MPKLVNRAKMTTATTGTGTLTLGSALAGYQTFANAGVANADVVRYVIEDGTSWEIGLGTYSAGTLTRGTIESSTGTAINLSGNATVFVTAAAGDLQELVTFADNFVLPTADGSTGQVLTTNGAGTLTFSTITGYTDADVDTHLNTGTASSGEVLSWTGSDYDWITSGGAGGAFSVVGTRNLAAITTLPDITTGTDNFAAGNDAGVNLTTGSNNVAIGNGALDAATTGSSNVAIGLSAGGSISTATRAIFIGEAAGSNASNGMGIGYRAARYSTAESNLAFGNEALSDTLLTGANNLAFGRQALLNTENGSQNCAFGNQSGQAIRAGSDNTLFGYTAGFAVSSGTQNTIFGSQAGATFGGSDITTGSNNTLLGYRASATSATVSNEITLGNSSISTLRCQVTTITSLSDARDKADIQPINAGLEFVEALNPVSFTWNMRDGGKVGEADTGFIAQDLQMAQEWAGVTIPGLVYDVNPDKLEAGYGKLIPVLVQAIKDLSEKVKDLEAKLEAQK